MVRFIHTADWQIGLRVRYIAGDAGARVRAARLDTLDRIGRLAHERAVDFVVVAGDVFEHHGLHPSTVRQTFDALASWPCPVYLLPGNHDPLTADSLYLSDLWRAAPPNVVVLASTSPVWVPLRPERAQAHTADGRPAAQVALLPCPLVERHTLDDTTGHLLPDFGPPAAPSPEHPGGVHRIGVAHGGVFALLGALLDGEEGLNNPIDAHAAARGALDYLALGDWHSTLRVDDRTWYSGAPEATRFKERVPGNVLVVEVDRPGAEPTVETVSVASQRWVQQAFQVNEVGDVAPLSAWLEDQPEKRNTLIELFLEGAPGAEALRALDEVLTEAEHRFLWIRRRDDGLRPLLSADDLDAIATTGWIRAALDELRDARDRGDAEAGDALRLLFRLHGGSGEANARAAGGAR